MGLSTPVSALGSNLRLLPAAVKEGVATAKPLPKVLFPVVPAIPGPH